MYELGQEAGNKTLRTCVSMHISCRRQKQDMDFCRHKIHMLLKENQCHRNDISNQTAQLALKVSLLIEYING